MNSFRIFAVLVWKDVRTEFRGKNLIVSSIAFGLLLLLMMGIALNAAVRLPSEFSAGLLWLSLLFSTTLSMTKHDYKELEMGAVYGVLMSPVDRSMPFYAKWLSTFLFILMAEVVLVLAFFTILNQPPPTSVGEFMFVMVAGAAGLTGIGTFLATLAAASSMRDIVLPLLLFPLSLPLFLALIRLTVYALVPELLYPWIWLEVLIGYVVSFAVLPWLLYEPLMEA